MSETPHSAQVVDAFQKAAGVLAARARGDNTGAATLLSSFADDATMASGFLLLAQVTVEFVSHATDTAVEQVLQDLVLTFEREVGDT